jgi:hypothetical protein
MSEHSSFVLTVQLGNVASEIKGRHRMAAQYADKAEQHAISAGLLLIEAKKLVEAKQYRGSFDFFVQRECGFGKDTAYKYLRIANGTSTLQQENEKSNERKQEYRERQTAETVRSGTDSQPVEKVEETASKPPAEKPKGGRPPKQRIALSPRQVLKKAIASELETLTDDQLATVLTYIKELS